MQVTDQPSPDAPSLTQAIIVQMVQSQKPSETNKFRLGEWRFSHKKSHWRLQLVICIQIGLVLKPEVRTFIRFVGREGVSTKTNFVRFEHFVRASANFCDGQ